MNLPDLSLGIHHRAHARSLLLILIKHASEIILQNIASNKAIYKSDKVTRLELYKKIPLELVDEPVSVMSKKIKVEGDVI